MIYLEQLIASEMREASLSSSRFLAVSGHKTVVTEPSVWAWSTCRALDHVHRGPKALEGLFEDGLIEAMLRSGGHSQWIWRGHGLLEKPLSLTE